MFDKKALFAYDDTVIEKVDCPEWGELGKDLYIRTMTSNARDTYEMGIVDASDNDEKDRVDGFMYNLRANLVVMCCCDKEGKLHFEQEDAKALGQKSAAALDRLFAVGKRLMRISDKDVKEMEKSLESPPS